MRFVAMLLVVGVAAALCAGVAHADSITLQMADNFGTSTPSGVPTITFTDAGANTVTITMDLTGLSSTTEKVTGWYINSAVALTLADFSFTSGSSSTVAVDTTWNTNDTVFKADGDGYYDVRFDFPTSGNTFVDGETVVWTVTHAGITAATFNVLGNASGGGSPGPFVSALHLQGTGTGGTSTWLGSSTPTPEPGTIFLLAAGIGGLVVRRRRAKARPV